MLVTDNLTNAVMRDDFDLWQAALPEGDAVYHLDSSGDISAYHMGVFSNQTGQKTETITAVQVLTWPDLQNPLAYIPDNDEAAIIYKINGEKTGTPQVSPTSWETAVLQQAEYYNAILHPERKVENQFHLVKGSIASGILSPYTAYIVLENEAQENMLKEKQKQILAAKSDVDLGENLGKETVMSEPGLLILAVLFTGAILLLKKRKSNRQTHG